MTVRNKNMNTNKNIWIWVIVCIVVILIGVGFYASYRATHTANAPTYNANQQGVSGQATSNQQEQTIDVRHQYVNGLHTYAGSIDVPTPCDMLSSKVVADGTDPTTGIAKFTLVFGSVSGTSNPASTCAQLITTRNFKLSFTGAQNAVVNATLDGQPVILNVFELQPGQDINSSIYLKG
jgi:hypothetical protein